MPAATSPASRGSSNFPPSAGRRLGRAGFRNFVRPPASPRARSPALRRRVTPTPPESGPRQSTPGVGRCLPQAEVEARGFRRRPQCRSLGPVTPPPSSPTWTPSSAFRCSGGRWGAGSAGWGGWRRRSRERTRAALLRASCATAAPPPPLLAGPPPSPFRASPSPSLPLCSSQLSGASTGRRATVATAAAAAAAAAAGRSALSQLICSL